MVLGLTLFASVSIGIAASHAADERSTPLDFVIDTNVNTASPPRGEIR